MHASVNASVNDAMSTRPVITSLSFAPGRQRSFSVAPPGFFCPRRRRSAKRLAGAERCSPNVCQVVPAPGACAQTERGALLRKSAVRNPHSACAQLRLAGADTESDPPSLSHRACQWLALQPQR